MTKGDKRFLATLAMMILFILAWSIYPDKAGGDNFTYRIYALMIAIIGMYFILKDAVIAVIQYVIQIKRRERLHARLISIIGCNKTYKDIIETEIVK